MAISSKQKHCHQCDAVIPRIAEVCPRCDVRQFVDFTQPTTTAPITRPLSIAPPQPTQLPARVRKSRSQAVAGLLAIFLGGFGIHQFYLGNLGRGLVYLFFWWTFIPTLLGWFDALRIFLSDEESFDNKYNG